MSKTLMVTIIKGKLKLTVPRENLIEVAETPDGVCFNFKEGVTFYYLNQYMKSHTKQLIKNTVDNYEGTNLMINLNESDTPIRVDAT